jgi:hypothetical protein
MKKIHWEVTLGISFIVVSAVLYTAALRIFHNPKDIFFWFMMSLAFLPFEVFLVSVVINRLINEKERGARLQKMNMVIGVFFSEVGTGLLRKFGAFDPAGAKALAQPLAVAQNWQKTDFDTAKKTIQSFGHKLSVDSAGLLQLQEHLAARRDFLLRLLENQNLLEHELFTDLLWAVFHLAEELSARKDLAALSAADREHLKNDAQRAYQLLISEWLDYMRHLQKNYPYLFSLAARTNPFNPAAEAELT